MKTTVKMLAFPMIGFALASAGAVSTNTAKISRTALPPQTAYIHTLADPCEPVQVECNRSNGPTCTYGINEDVAWDKDSPDAPCNVPLFKNQN